MTVRMLVVLRIRLAAALAALLAAACVAVALSASGKEGSRAGGDTRVLRIRAASAPLVAADLAGVWDRRPDSDLLPVWLAQYPGDERQLMRDWLSYHDARVSTGRFRLRVETSSGPGTDGWFRLAVDRRAGRVTLTCGGSPAPGCFGGRWRLDRFGLSPRDLLH